MKLQIKPLRSDFLIKTREHRLDDQHQAVEYHLAKGGEPCRDVLRGAMPGEALILASYCPFSQASPYKEYGPVFILAEPSTEAVSLEELPSVSGAVTDYFGERIVLRAYSSTERIVQAELTTPADCTEVLARFFADPDVSFVLFRNVAYGCYSLRVERADER